MTRDDVESWMDESGAARTDSLPTTRKGWVDVFFAVALRATEHEREQMSCRCDSLNRANISLAEAVRVAQKYQAAVIARMNK